MTLRRMTRAQNRQVQMKLHRDQGGLCPICKLPINLAAGPKDNGPVTDHSHIDGRVRALLHRGCNGFLGKAEGTTRWAGVSPTNQEAIADMLIAAGNYLKQPGIDLLYYTWKTEEEAKAAQNAKRRRVRAQRKARAVVKSGGTDE